MLPKDRDGERVEEEDGRRLLLKRVAVRHLSVLEPLAADEVIEALIAAEREGERRGAERDADRRQGHVDPAPRASPALARRAREHAPARDPIRSCRPDLNASRGGGGIAQRWATSAARCWSPWFMRLSTSRTSLSMFARSSSPCASYVPPSPK